jgi:hypothetical protein
MCRNSRRFASSVVLSRHHRRGLSRRRSRVRVPSLPLRKTLVIGGFLRLCAWGLERNLGLSTTCEYHMKGRFVGRSVVLRSDTPEVGGRNSASRTPSLGGANH